MIFSSIRRWIKWFRDHVGPIAALLVIVAAAFMDLLDGTIVQVALPSIQRNFLVDDAALQWNNVRIHARVHAAAGAGATGGRLRSAAASSSGLVRLSYVLGRRSAQRATLITFRALQGASAAMMLPRSSFSSGWSCCPRNASRR